MKEENILFVKIVYQWLEVKKTQTTLSTWVKYEQLIRNYIETFFEGISCNNLNEELLNLFYSKIQVKSDDVFLSSGTINTIIMIINQVCSFAYDNQFVYKKLYLKPCISRKKSIVNVFNTNEQKIIEKYIYESNDIYSLAILLALYSGIRIGELCALKWEDIDFTNGSLKITKTVQRLKNNTNNSINKTILIVTEPKSTSSYRVIPLPPFVFKYIKKFSLNKSSDAYIFTNKKELPLEPRTLQYAYKKILKYCGIKYLNFHCLRHTFATRCIMMGLDVKTLSEILGHSDIEITMEYYFHSSFEFKKMQMSKLKLIS